MFSDSKKNQVSCWSAVVRFFWPGRTGEKYLVKSTRSKRNKQISVPILGQKQWYEKSYFLVANANQRRNRLLFFENQRFSTTSGNIVTKFLFEKNFNPFPTKEINSGDDEKKVTSYISGRVKPKWEISRLSEPLFILRIKGISANISTGKNNFNEKWKYYLAIFWLVDLFVMTSA